MRVQSNPSWIADALFDDYEPTPGEKLRQAVKEAREPGAVVTNIVNRKRWAHVK